MDHIQVPIAQRFAYTNTNWEQFQAKLQNYEFRALKGENPEKIEDEWERFQEAIVEARNETTPILRYRWMPTIYLSPPINRLKGRLP